MAVAAVHPIYRAQHGLSPAALEVLAAGRQAVLGTLNPDGSVHLVPALYLFEHGRFCFETSGTTRKAANVRAGRGATVLVQDPRVDGTAWVSGRGPARIVEGKRAQELNRCIRARYLTERGEQQLGKVMAVYDDVSIVVEPTRWMSWDIGAFNATLEAHGVNLEGASDWFLPVLGQGSQTAGRQ